MSATIGIASDEMNGKEGLSDSTTLTHIELQDVERVRVRVARNVATSYDHRVYSYTGETIDRLAVDEIIDRLLDAYPIYETESETCTEGRVHLSENSYIVRYELFLLELPLPKMTPIEVFEIVFES